MICNNYQDKCWNNDWMNGEEESLFCYSPCCSFLWMKETAGFESLQLGHLTKLLEEDFWADVSTLHVQRIISAVSELVERLKSSGEDGTAAKHTVTSGSLRASHCPRGLSRSRRGFTSLHIVFPKQASLAESLRIWSLCACRPHWQTLENLALAC